MEEFVGKLWHRLISRAADSQHADAVVTLEDIRTTVGIFFRAMGGDGGLRVAAAQATEHAARRNWLQRVAGSGGEVELAWRDDETLRLPAQIAVFHERGLNRDLYLWLAALAASAEDEADLPRAWLTRNQALTRHVLTRYPGMQSRYKRLSEAQLALRPALDKLDANEAAQEQAIQQALREPGSVTVLPPARHAPRPVYLWLHPSPPGQQSAMDGHDDNDDELSGQTCDDETRKRRGERVDATEREGGIITLRMENMLTWGEFINADRETEEDEDGGSAVEEMETLSITRNKRTIASRLRFDLDLPSSEYDDIPLGEGILLPEWDYRRRSLQPNHCRLQPMLARETETTDLPLHLRRTAQHIRRQFEALTQNRTWLKAQPEGSEMDLSAWLDFAVARRSGLAVREQGLYRDFRNINRDLACLLLADLSLSTDAAVNNEQKIIDVIRDSLFLFAEALSAVGDRFAMYGFSSRKREHIRFHTLKEFDEKYDGTARGRIQAIRPGYYTRMGAALRQASNILGKESAGRQLLLLLTDGKPNDLDQYEGRYGIEDTRHALHEAREAGYYPFCVTIDQHAGDYLPHLFGAGNYVVIRRPDELPRQLPLLYAKLTGN
ncbi:MAG: VWA domain-containing protein [Thiohalomonadaceae bacterium]